MNKLGQQPGEDRLNSLLRESRPEPALPPRFQENVWRRIERADAQSKPASWISLLAGLILKPRFALATAAIVLVTGTFLGSLNGQAQARQVAQERYVTAVVMPIAQ